ncbi:hypothetical protein [Ferruginibacter sp.]|nr:hypothetical protein [Ferruginibacter sp.]
MKKLLLTTLVVLSVGISYAQKQKVKAPATASTTPAPPVKTPPTAPPKPTARKIKPPLPPSMGIEKEFDTRHPIRQDTTRTKY